MAVAQSQPFGDQESWRDRRIAVLDDDPAILRTIELMAHRLGLQAKTCTNLVEFEAVLASFAPDILLIDLMMPDLDGIDVVRRVGPRPESALFVMSGADRRTFEASRKVLASGGTVISGFLSKPFGARELACVLSSSPMTSSTLHARRHTGLVRDILSPQEFQRAVVTGRIEPYYQPIFLSDGKTLKGFEALARIEGGRVNCFAPEYLDQLVANRNLSAKLTDLIIDRSLRFLADLVGYDELTLSINVLGTYAIAEGFRASLVERCKRHGIVPNRVILEISEANVFGLDEDGLCKITQLRLAGFGLSIDDFGTGHSSLGRLAGLPFSELKIDKTFCLNLPQSKAAAAIIEACIGLAAKLDLSVTAEGVETEQVAAMLTDMGCNAFQGHLFGQAMSCDTVSRWLTESSISVAANSFRNTMKRISGYAQGHAGPGAAGAAGPQA